MGNDHNGSYEINPQNMDYLLIQAQNGEYQDHKIFLELDMISLMYHAVSHILHEPPEIK